MKLHANIVSALNVFTAYADDHVCVNQIKHGGSLIVTPTSVDTWRPLGFSDLRDADFEALLAYQPEIVLLGTGTRLQFPHPRLTSTLLQAHIGVDAMDISAMCRTFNVLVAEDRRVIAAVLFS